MEDILISRCRDPRLNLALEEFLIEQGKSLLFLWRNDPSVIIGRNQDPYAECEPDLLAKDGIYLVRRKSGGGAVYHDPGNLNITILSTKNPEAVDKNFSFLCRALHRLGVEAAVSGRNDLEVQGRKVSGSAFYETDQGFCHHCTMLVSVDKDAMTRYLKPSPLKLQSKGIQSVRSRVANLSELIPGLTVADLLNALSETAEGIPRWVDSGDMTAIPQVAEKAQRYGSWAWTFGESPRSNLVLEEKFSWGLIKAEMEIVNGRVKSCRLYTDSLRTDGFEALARSLTGLPLRGKEFREAIEAFSDPVISRDLQKLLL